MDVRFDLSAIIPQIPKAVLALENLESASIQFYEQGIERELHFVCIGDEITIECRSLEGDPLVEEKAYMNKSEVVVMLNHVLSVFLSVSNELCPYITNHPIFRDWEAS